MAEKNTTLVSAFKGINRRCHGEKGELVKAQNVSAEEYPCLAAIKGPKQMKMTDSQGNQIKNIRAVICSEEDFDGKFSGVAGTNFYYKGKKIPFYSDAQIPAEGRIELEEMNGNIIICCYNSFEERSLLFYNYHKYTKHTQKNASGKVVRLDCVYFVSADDIGTKYLPAAKDSYNTTTYSIYSEGGACFANVEVGDSIVLCNLIANSMTGQTYAYARETVIRKSRYESTSASGEIACIITKKVINEYPTLSYIEYQAYNTEGKIVKPKGYTSYDINNEKRKTSPTQLGPVIRKATPVMNSVCIHNNRLWGVNPNGEYIYASKLGDFREFNSFKGVASDSYYMGIGSGGGFEGIVSYRNYVIAFKRNCIHIVSGTTPNNFSLARTVEGIGCIDIKSCAEVGGYLYFLSKDGFYRFDGVGFENISQKLAAKYQSAIGKGKNNKYYVYAKDTDGNSEMLVFDARYDMWHSMSDFGEIVGFFDNYGQLYTATDEAIYELYADECREWEIQSCEFFEEDCSNAHPNSLWIRASIDKGKTVRVLTACDGGEYVEHTSCMGTGKVQIYHIPVRWHNSKSHSVKLVGNGNAIIYDIELRDAQGGRQYKERKQI